MLLKSINGTTKGIGVFWVKKSVKAGFSELRSRKSYNGQPKEGLTMSPDKDDDIKPDVNTGELIWVTLGSDPGTRAVVSTVYSDSTKPGCIEIVYLDSRDRPIYEDAIWKEKRWEFKASGLAGGYANRTPRLSEAVAILRRGRH